jgi:formylglycine-generating enzyme required for sulfatase activity
MRYVDVQVPAWAILIEADPDPLVVTDDVLRTAISSTGLAWRVRDSITQIELLLIPPITFAMGCSASLEWECSSAEVPIHDVTLTNAFYLGRTEVTQAQWLTTMGWNPSAFQGQADSSARPVEQVSWNSIAGFLLATGFRAPTEAEWEHACRAGTNTAFNNGSDDDPTVSDVAWYQVNTSGQTRPVGLKVPNALGLHDMHGNVWEWVSNFCCEYYQRTPVTDPTGPPSGTQRMVRGGSWENTTERLRSSHRSTLGVGDSWHSVGFRVARDP